MGDAELLEKFSRTGSDASFAEIVKKYLPLVYSAALRQVRNAAVAEDVAQVVFIILSQKARRLSSGTILAAWLFSTTRYVAYKAIRGEVRRINREQEALKMQTDTQNDVWDQIAPVIDEALYRLNETDRSAVLLHYFENKKLKDVGEALGLNEDAAQKRVSRAVRKLRALLLHRGVALPAVVIPGLLMTRAVGAVPHELCNQIVSTGLNKAVLSTSAYALLKQSTACLAASAMAMKAGVGIVVIVIAGAGLYLYEAHSHAQARLRQPPNPIQARVAARAQHIVTVPAPQPVPSPRVVASASPKPEPLEPAAAKPIETASRPPLPLPVRTNVTQLVPAPPVVASDNTASQSNTAVDQSGAYAGDTDAASAYGPGAYRYGIRVDIPGKGAQSANPGVSKDVAPPKTQPVGTLRSAPVLRSAPRSGLQKKN